MTLGDVLNVVGLAISVLGFGFTIGQLRRTAKASEATKVAIESANKRMVLNHMLVLLPQMKAIEGDLDAAISTDDRQNAIRVLVEFSYTAKTIASLLETEDDEQASLVVTLRTAAANASASKASLVNGIAKPLRVILKTVAQEISDVSSDCAALSTRYHTRVA